MTRGGCGRFFRNIVEASTPARAWNGGNQSAAIQGSYFGATSRKQHRGSTARLGAARVAERLLNLSKARSNPATETMRRAAIESCSTCSSAGGSQRDHRQFPAQAAEFARALRPSATPAPPPPEATGLLASLGASSARSRHDWCAVAFGYGYNPTNKYCQHFTTTLLGAKHLAAPRSRMSLGAVLPQRLSSCCTSSGPQVHAN